MENEPKFAKTPYANYKALFQELTLLKYTEEEANHILKTCRDAEYDINYPTKIIDNIMKVIRSGEKDPARNLAFLSAAVGDMERTAPRDPNRAERRAERFGKTK